MKLLITIFVLVSSFCSYSQSQSFFDYKDCVDFNFSEASNDCHFIKELNKAAMSSHDLASEQFYVMRYINSSNNKVVSYDIENLTPQLDIEGRDSEFLEINFSEKLDRYIIELQRKHFGKIEVLDFWD